MTNSLLTRKIMLVHRMEEPFNILFFRLVIKTCSAWPWFLPQKKWSSISRNFYPDARTSYAHEYETDLSVLNYCTALTLFFWGGKINSFDFTYVESRPTIQNLHPCTWSPIFLRKERKEKTRKIWYRILKDGTFQSQNKTHHTKSIYPSFL